MASYFRNLFGILLVGGIIALASFAFGAIGMAIEGIDHPPTDRQIAGMMFYAWACACVVGGVLWKFR